MSQHDRIDDLFAVEGTTETVTALPSRLAPGPARAEISAEPASGAGEMSLEYSHDEPWQLSAGAAEDLTGAPYFSTADWRLNERRTRRTAAVIASIESDGRESLLARLQRILGR